MPLFQNAVLKKYLSGVDEKKVELTLSEEAVWMEYFNQQKAQADDLKSQIAQTDSEIDGMAYGLYGLGEEEVKVVDGFKLNKQIKENRNA